MSELLHLLSDWHHWAFEIITGGVFVIVGMVVPERFNFVKRLIARHDRHKHGIFPDDREARMARLDAWLVELEKSEPGQAARQPT